VIATGSRQDVATVLPGGRNPSRSDRQVVNMAEYHVTLADLNKAHGLFEKVGRK
jgi:hypothetical protein